MFSPWTEVQGQAGDSGQRRRQELQELLLRQEKILSNRGLLQTLPDKGKKIKEYAEKLRLAIERHDEEERRRSLVPDTGVEYQSKYKQAFTAQRRAVSTLPAASHHNQQSEASAVSAYMKKETISDRKEDQSSSTAAAIETKETATAGASLNSDLTKEHFLVESLEKFTLSERGTGLSIEPKEPLNSMDCDNYFARNKMPKKPHIVTILEKNEQISLEPRKEKFKPNQLPQRNSIPPSESSSPSQLTEQSSPLSVQARRERDRKHLDDITAARLPPLHHNPAQLLTLEESAVLLKEQTKKHQELQAKQAAQKLSEELKISMGSYTPDGGLMAAYREVRDEGDQLSDED